MGWTEVMEELESKLEGTRKGTYRPLDGIPFFRVQYPPQEEREALKEFALLGERLRHRGWLVKILSLTEVFEEALSSLLNCPPEKLPDRLKNLEQERGELQQQLAQYLPNELVRVLAERLREMPANGVAILIRMGALYPFLRSSVLLSRLEGRVTCMLVLGCPEIEQGGMLNASAASYLKGYYRGEIIAWK